MIDRPGVVHAPSRTSAPAPAATAFDLSWPHAYASEIISAWQFWSPEAPDELAASRMGPLAGGLGGPGGGLGLPGF